VEAALSWKQTKALLNKLVELTTESRRINVLLAVSSIGYPYRLRAGGVFNMSTITDVIFAGEVSPADMRVLLQEKLDTWARAFTDVFLAVLRWPRVHSIAGTRRALQYA